jgi:ABC-2 type transport system permease protein
VNALNATLTDNLYVAWAIASKDILDAVKNKSARTNIILIMGMVLFFYWASTPRPFDKRIDVVVVDEGDAGLSNGLAGLSDGYSLNFSRASSREEMARLMGYKELAIVIPSDFDQQLKSGNEPILSAYILWVHRTRAAELEAKYSEKFTEFFGQPVRIEIGENFVIPEPDVETSSSVQFLFLFATMWLALALVPHLMIEEKQTKTMDALLVSPASAGQVVIGKALAGMFYVLLCSGLFFALNWAYITNWMLALLAFVCCSLFGIGLALAIGGLVKSPQQLTIWMIPVILALLLPALFSQEPNLSQGLRSLFAWLPTTALVELFQLAMSSRGALNELLTNLAIVLICTVLVYSFVIFQVRRADR